MDQLIGKLALLSKGTMQIVVEALLGQVIQAHGLEQLFWGVVGLDTQMPQNRNSTEDMSGCASHGNQE